MHCGQRSGWAQRPGEGQHRGYAAFSGANGTSPGLSLGETKVTWREGIKEVGRMTREVSVPSGTSLSAASILASLGAT